MAFDRVVSSLLADRFGFFEVKAKEIADYHTQSIEVPASLFRNAIAAERPPRPAPEN